MKLDSNFLDIEQDEGDELGLDPDARLDSNFEDELGANPSNASGVLETHTISDIQKALYGVGWTTARLKNDGLYGPQTKNAWAVSARNRGLDTTLNRVDGTHAKVNSETYSKIAADAAHGVSLPNKTTKTVSKPSNAKAPLSTPKAVVKPAAQDQTAQRKGAAIGLRDYLAKSGDFGSSAKRSDKVRAYQAAMNMGSNAIGIVGPITRKTALVYGVTLPPNPADVNKVLAPHAATIAATKPVAGKATSTASPKLYAKGLQTYLAKTRDFGSVAKPSKPVATFQSKMGGLKVDGIVGPKTRDRAKALGYSLPNAVGAKPAVINKSTGKSGPLQSYKTRRADRKSNKTQIGGSPNSRGPQYEVTIGQAEIKDQPSPEMEVIGKEPTPEQQAKAREALGKIDYALDEFPDFPLWDTYKFRRTVIGLLRIAAGKAA